MQDGGAESFIPAIPTKIALSLSDVILNPSTTTGAELGPIVICFSETLNILLFTSKSADCRVILLLNP